RRTTPKRYGRTHSNGCSSHSTGIPNADKRNFFRAFVDLPWATVSTVGTPVSRLKRLVSATSGQICAGEDSRSNCQTEWNSLGMGGKSFRFQVPSLKFLSRSARNRARQRTLETNLKPETASRSLCTLNPHPRPKKPRDNFSTALVSGSADRLSSSVDRRGCKRNARSYSRA